MKTQAEIEDRLKALLERRAALFAAHQRLSIERESIGGQINAVDGSITTLRSVLELDASAEPPA